MRTQIILIILLLGSVGSISAQQRDSTTIPSDSAAAARADSLQLVRELEELLGAGEGETELTAASPTGPINPRMLPDISVVGDLVADLSPDGSTLEGAERFAVREVEVALQAVVDPYFRAGVFLGFSDAEGAAVEQAKLTTTALPYGLQATLGRFLMPVGKLNNSHRHSLHTVDFPHVVQQFLGEEGLKGTGVEISRIFAPFGFYQELLVTAVDGLGESEEGLVTERPANRRLKGLGYSARLRNYVDISESSNIEISTSVLTGLTARPLALPIGDINAANARQSVVGADLTFRWRPLREGLYESFLLRAEYLYQFNDDDVQFAPALTDRGGAYIFARYQLTRRLFLGSRLDWVQAAVPAGDDTRAASAYLEFYPSEFSKLLATYERLSPAFSDPVNRLIFQATFAIGPHKPHPF
ncbi:MAG TPA: hypothetical protein VFI91_12360 [Longimicrobiaceae bacterium]|nr:hypothetical protein [Longimicrobiaceae bacterium]